MEARATEFGESDWMEMADLINELNLGRSSLYGFMRKGIFPLPIKLGARSLWVRKEIEAWKKKRLREGLKQRALKAKELSELRGEVKADDDTDLDGILG